MRGVPALGPQWDPGVQNAEKPPGGGFEFLSDFSSLVAGARNSYCSHGHVYGSKREGHDHNFWGIWLDRIEFSVQNKFSKINLLSVQPFSL